MTQPGQALSGPMTSWYFMMPSLSSMSALAHSSRILHLGLGSLIQISPSGSHLHGRSRSQRASSWRSTQLGTSPWSFGIISPHVRPFPGSVWASGASQSSSESGSWVLAASAAVAAALLRRASSSISWSQSSTQEMSCVRALAILLRLDQLAGRLALPDLPWPVSYTHLTLPTIYSV